MDRSSASTKCAENDSSKKIIACVIQSHYGGSNSDELTQLAIQKFVLFSATFEPVPQGS